MCLKSTSRLNIVSYNYSIPYYERRVVVKSTSLGLINQIFARKSLRKGGKYKWIILANKTVEAVARKNVCTKFEKNLSIMLQTDCGLWIRT